MVAIDFALIRQYNSNPNGISITSVCLPDSSKFRQKTPAKTPHVGEREKLKEILLDGLLGLLVVTVPIALIGIANALVRKIVATRRTLRHIDMEISRTDGEERRYWRHKRKRLLLSLIPFSKWFRRRS